MQNLKKMDKDKWRIRFKYTDPLTRNQRIFHETFHGSLQEARARRDEAKAAARSGSLSVASRAGERLRDYEPSFLRMRGSREGKNGKSLRRSTKERDIAIISTHIIPDAGDWLVPEIRLRHLEELVDYWREKPYIGKDGKPVKGKHYKPGAINTWIRVMKVYLGHCCRLAGIDNPAEHVQKLPVRAEEKTCLTIEESGLLLGYLREHSPQWYPFVLISLLTGARFSEVSALRWEDIDEDRRVIRMGRSQYRGTAREGNKAGKFVQSPLLPEMSSALRAWRIRMIAEMHPGVATGLVFPATKVGVQNGYRSGSGLRRVLKQACEALEIPVIGVHEMRNTFISTHIECGIPLEFIKASTGQDLDKTTYHYAHISMDARVAASAPVAARITRGVNEG
jgi:integrase